MTPQQLLIPRYENETAEVWAKIPGFEQYEISNKGSIKKTIIRTITNKRGGDYPKVELYGSKSNGNEPEKKKFLLHRLIAMAFIENPNNLPYVNHKDGDRSNFSIDNLEWCTASENSKHAYDTGLNIPDKTHQNKMVVQVDTSLNIVKIWNGIKELQAKGHTWNKVYDSIKKGIFYKKCKWYYPGINYDYLKNQYFIGNAAKKTVLTKSEMRAFVFDNYTDEIKAKLSVTPPLNNCRKVANINSDGTIIKAYLSIREASKDLGIERTEIGRCARGKIKSIKGLKWRFITETDYLNYINANK